MRLEIDPGGKRLSICCKQMLKAISVNWLQIGKELGTEEPIVMPSEPRCEEPIKYCPWCREEPVANA